MIASTAVLPIKRFGDAKQRLGEEVSEGTRRALAEAMATDVLIALRRSRAINNVLVVTGEASAVALAAGYDAAVIDDPTDEGHNAAAVRGIAAAVERGAKRVVLVPGDCPALDPRQLDALLGDTQGAPEVVVVPDRHGSGTNALVLTPPDVMIPSFGIDSRPRHEELAHKAGATCRVVEVPSLGLDIDTLQDLEALHAALGEVRGGASHTRGLLARVARR